MSPTQKAMGAETEVGVAAVAAVAEREVAAAKAEAAAAAVPAVEAPTVDVALTVDEAETRGGGVPTVPVAVPMVVATTAPDRR